MLKELIGYSTVFILLLFPSNLFSTNTKTTCDLLKLPHECHCQQTRHISTSSLNETRLRCRQLTEITTDHYWSTVPYERLVFDTPNDNLTLHRFAFADIVVRTLRFNAQNLLFNDHTFLNAYIGQLTIFHQDTYGTINFQLNSQIFYGSTITNLYFKSINFQSSISEILFSNARIYTLVIKASKFYGFTNENLEINSNNQTKIQHNHFLEYDFMSLNDQQKIQRQLLELTDESSSIESEQTVSVNITSVPFPTYITIFTIISSINITNLTKNYFPNNIEYRQTDEIELSYNQITSLDAHAFLHLKQFQGRLILENNQIKYLNPHAFADLFLLKYLSLAKNSIQNFSSKHFENLEQLYELDLSSNRIYQLNNNTFQYLPNLHRLHLNYNPLEFIHSDTFVNLTRLKQISFHGVQFIHLIDQEYFQWIWNLASLHVIHVLNTDFDLSDVAFCILTRYNQTLFHLSHEHSCSCNIHYLYRNQDYSQNDLIPISKYQTNYLRLTPICNQNNTESIFEELQNVNTSDLRLQGLENKCNYKLMFLDCNAMTTTTTEMTTISETETDSNTPVLFTTEVPVPITTSRRTKELQTSTKSLNNIKKLFTVLGTLIAITISAIILVFFWYRFKAMLKRRQKKKQIAEQQRHFNSPVNNNDKNDHQSTAPFYASSDISSSTHSAQLSASKCQSKALIELPTSQPSNIYNDIETIDNFIDDESLEQDSTEMQATTQC